MRKRVLIGERNKELLDKLVELAGELNASPHIKTVDCISDAYEYSINHTVDVFIIGKLSETDDKICVQEYQFILNLRQQRQYMFTPIILISNVEDVTNFAFKVLHCFDLIEKPFSREYVKKCMEKAILYTTRRYGKRSIFIKVNGTIHSLHCDNIVRAKVENRGIRFFFDNKEELHIKYITIKKFLDIADCRFLIQSHRNSIVNGRKIKQINYSDRNITMKDGSTAALGETYVGIIKEEFI